MDMDKEEEEKLSKFFAKAFQEVVLPVIEDLTNKLSGLQDRVEERLTGMEERLGRVEDKLDKIDDRLDRHGQTLDDHEKRMLPWKLPTSKSIDRICSVNDKLAPNAQYLIALSKMPPLSPNQASSLGLGGSF